jgi:hypothetical protein
MTENEPTPQPESERLVRGGQLAEIAEIAQAVGGVAAPVAAYYGAKLSNKPPEPPPAEPPQVVLPPGVERD